MWVRRVGVGVLLKSSVFLSELVDGLHASSLLPFSSSRFRQPLSGSLLVDLQDGTFAALVVSPGCAAARPPP